MQWTLPNILTMARILLAPVIALLPFIQGFWPKLVALIIFIGAGITDWVDGYLARTRNEVSDLGKLLDPLADKLLLFATLVPIYWLTRHPTLPVNYEIPWWGNLPLWVLLLMVGREVIITVFRMQAKRQGVIIAAGSAGKLKAVFQDIFIGATIAWFAWKDGVLEYRWVGWFQRFWDRFHGLFVAVTLGIAVGLTVYSLAVYLYQNRDVLRGTARQ